MTDDFPYQEFRRPDGNFFASWREAISYGWKNDQIWSVVEGDDEDVWVYGPPHHFVNVLGYVATHETHDHETYFEERFERDFLEGDENDPT